MRHQSNESVENYLEAILILKTQDKVVRVKDISRYVKVSMPSVHTALHVLEDRGFIRHEKYGYVELTYKGENRAKEIYASHILLTEFLSGILGVPTEIAQQDACKIEHVISNETLNRIAVFTKQSIGKASRCHENDEHNAA
jgi:DtxR family transcriptional regulator, Mn-dependent transcriptional regulator